MKALPFQRGAVRRMTGLLLRLGFALCLSATGTGKTFMALLAAKGAGAECVCVVCPASLVCMWRQVLRKYAIRGTVLSFAGTRGTRKGLTAGGLLCRTESVVGDKTTVHYAPSRFYRHLATRTCLIVDEAHAGKNDTLTNEALAALCSLAKFRVLMTATLYDKPEHAPAMLRLSTGSAQSLATAHKDARGLRFASGVVRRAEKVCGGEHLPVYMPAKAAEVPNVAHALMQHLLQLVGVTCKLPFGDKHLVHNWVLPPKVTSEQTCRDAIAKLQSAVVHYNRKRASASAFGKLTKALLEVERIKAREVAQYVLGQLRKHANLHMIVYFNYRKPLAESVAALEAEGYNVLVLHGDVPMEERQVRIAAFQSRDTSHRVLLCMSQVSGVGLSLDDTFGDRPREALVMPSFMAVTMVQVFGRIWRATTRIGDPDMPPTTRVVYLPGSKRVMDALVKKGGLLGDLSERAGRRHRHLLDTLPTVYASA